MITTKEFAPLFIAEVYKKVVIQSKEEKFILWQFNFTRVEEN
jgi:hypothetical protein